MKNKQMLLCADVLSLAATKLAAPPAFPDRAVTLVVPVGPGGTSAIMARFLQQPLSEVLGQPVVIDNKAGAGGAIRHVGSCKDARRWLHHRPIGHRPGDVAAQPDEDWLHTR